MANVDGKWDCAISTPMGEQAFVLTVVSSGDRFSGSAHGSIGGMEIPDGMVEGDTIAWTMHVSKPMPITLTCRATAGADVLEGTMKAGILGSFPFKGTRLA